MLSLFFDPLPTIPKRFRVIFQLNTLVPCRPSSVECSVFSILPLIFSLVSSLNFYPSLIFSCFWARCTSFNWKRVSPLSPLVRSFIPGLTPFDFSWGDPPMLYPLEWARSSLMYPIFLRLALTELACVDCFDSFGSRRSLPTVYVTLHGIDLPVVCFIFSPPLPLWQCLLSARKFLQC